MVCLALVIAGGAALGESPDWNALGKAWWAHIQFLADDRLEGRGTGTPGFEKAADYMVEQFRAAGLQPAGVDGYRQRVDFHVLEIDEKRCSLDLLDKGKVVVEGSFNELANSTNDFVREFFKRDA